jgi:Domain of unknown function (DUF4293)
LLCNNTNIFLGYNSISKKENIFLLKKINKMLQRIQTIYLLLAFIITGILPFLFPLWTMSDGKQYFFMQNMIYATLFGLSTTLSLLSIISYNKRQNQFVIGRLNMILNLILLGLFVYRSLNISGETLLVSEKGIGMFLPIIAIVFLALANKAIKKDEDLVKSVDRLR